MDDRRDGIEKRQGFLAGQRLDCLGERRRGEGAGGNDDAVPVLGGQAGDLGAIDGDQRFGFQGGLNAAREMIPVDRQRAARRDTMRVGGSQDERVRPPHFLMQQPDGARVRIVGAKRVGTDQLGQPVGLVRFRAAMGAHFVQDHRHPGARDLPGGFRARQPAADNVDGRRRGHARFRFFWRDRPLR